MTIVSNFRYFVVIVYKVGMHVAVKYIHMYAAQHPNVCYKHITSTTLKVLSVILYFSISIVWCQFSFLYRMYASTHFQL